MASTTTASTTAVTCFRMTHRWTRGIFRLFLCLAMLLCVMFGWWNLHQHAMDDVALEINDAYDELSSLTITKVEKLIPITTSDVKPTQIMSDAKPPPIRKSAANVLLMVNKTTKTRRKQSSTKRTRMSLKDQRRHIEAMHNHSTFWRPRPGSDFKIPFPVFVASLPKSGTTSIHAYFSCGRVRSIHTYCPDEGGRIGERIQFNVLSGKPPLQDCGDYNNTRFGPVNVYTDTGHVAPGGPCYYPSVSALEVLYHHYPNMTIMLSTRNSTTWSQSMSRWGSGQLLRRWSRFCSFIVPRDNNATVTDFINFYNWHSHHVRTFAQQHPSITYVEIAIDAPNASQQLERITGISASCWGNFQPDRSDTWLQHPSV